MSENIFLQFKKISAFLTIFAVVFLLSAVTANARYLSKGMTGEDVKELQTALQAQGYYMCGANCQVDGNFGTQTETAVKEVQQHQGIAVNGIVGPDTASFLGLQITSNSKICAIPNDPACGANEVCNTTTFKCEAKSGTSGGSTTGTGPKCPANNPLCVPDSPYVGTSLAGSSSIMDLVGKVLKYLLFFAGIVAVVAMIIGGYQYIAARGNEEMVEQGQKTLTNAIIGLIVVIMAYTIVNLLVKSLTGDPTQPTGYIQKLTKEV